MIVKYDLDVAKFEIEASDAIVNLSFANDIDIIHNVINGKLSKITIQVKGIHPVCINEDLINSEYPNAYNKAITAARFIANAILFQTGVDINDTIGTLAGSGQLQAEIIEEEAILKKNRVVSSSFTMGWIVRDKFSGASILFPNNTALAFWGEAKRTNSPFAKFILFYSVIEYFFSEKSGDSFDREVAAYVSKLDDIYDISKIERLRHIRIACTHPKPKKATPKNPANEEDKDSVEKAIPEIEKLALLLIKNPPSEEIK